MPVSQIDDMTSITLLQTMIAVSISHATVLAGIGMQIRTLQIDIDASMQTGTEANLADIADFHNKFFICAHEISDSIRAGSDPTDMYTSQTRRRLGRRPVWFLITDHHKLKLAAIDRWGGGVSNQLGAVWRKQSEHTNESCPYLSSVLTPSLLGHSSHAAASLRFVLLQHSMVEQFLFSLCHFHIINQGSGFGRLPAVLGMHPFPAR